VKVNFSWSQHFGYIGVEERNSSQSTEHGDTEQANMATKDNTCCLVFELTMIADLPLSRTGIETFEGVIERESAL
jgi:hypothetical protein